MTLAHAGRLPNLAEVFAGLFPPHYRKRLVLMFRSFLDASEDGAGRCVTVAGFVGSVSGWCHVQDKWQGIRARLGVPYFHMVDFMAKEPRAPYDELTREERIALMVEHGKLVGSSLMFGVSTSLNLRDYYALSESDQALFDNNPRGYCIAQCMAQVSNLLKHQWDIDESVLYVVEVGGRGENAVVDSTMRIFIEAEGVRDTLRVFSVLPGTKKQFPGLDTADILAWLANQHSLKHREGEPPQPRSPYLNMIELDCESSYLYGDHLLAVRDTLRAVKPSSLTLFGRLAARRQGQG